MPHICQVSVCPHEFEFCVQCNQVYCSLCGEEWGNRAHPTRPDGTIAIPVLFGGGHCADS